MFSVIPAIGKLHIPRELMMAIDNPEGMFQQKCRVFFLEDHRSPCNASIMQRYQYDLFCLGEFYWLSEV
jgi:hypothetical protein